jgi:hypothetical protein
MGRGTYVQFQSNMLHILQSGVQAVPHHLSSPTLFTWQELTEQHEIVASRLSALYQPMHAQCQLGKLA